MYSQYTTLFQLLDNDPEKLLRLLQDVYSYGVEDGFKADDKNSLDVIFRDWSSLEKIPWLHR